jgi:hypothetical protein
MPATMLDDASFHVWPADPAQQAKVATAFSLTPQDASKLRPGDRLVIVWRLWRDNLEGGNAK